MVLKLNTTPFTYYYEILSEMLKNDRSYDSLPNFTAADCAWRDEIAFAALPDCVQHSPLSSSSAGSVVPFASLPRLRRPCNNAHAAHSAHSCA
jgi:hypothetical protein